jgi:DNA-nicking Smr family endonuclease
VSPAQVKVKVTSLAELKTVQREIAARIAQEAKHAAEQARARRQASSERELFIRAAGVVQPLPDKRRAMLKKAPPVPVVMRYQHDEQAVLQEAISDEFDVGTLLDTDDLLSFRRPGIGTDVTRKLRRARSPMSAR